MTLEVLYPELGGLYGELANVRYLRASVPGLQVIETHLGQRPAVLDGRAELVYMGAMSENGQELALRTMLPLREELRRVIEDGAAFLATGNAMELFGKAIRDGEKAIPALGIFDYEAERDMEHRHNSMFLGEMEGMPVVGCKSQYSHLISEPEQSLFTVQGGFGTSLKGNREGIRYRNFLGTYVMGPLLPLNPPLTAWLISLLGWQGTPAFQKEGMEAYELRLAELRRPGVNFLVGEHG